MEDLDFSQINKLVNYRYVTGQCSDMSEILEFTKIQLLNSMDNCVKRVSNWGYTIYKNEDNETDKNIDLNEDNFFLDRLNLAKIRYFTGKSKNLKETLQTVKMIVNEDIEHSVKRLISKGYKVITPMDLKENEYDYGHAFDDILGKAIPIEDVLEHAKIIEDNINIIPTSNRTVESLNICIKD